MAQLTNLNVSPYYDDFNDEDNFHKVLFRPGFSIQARELTTLQSILQNQIEKQGEHIFKEGTVVIPGQVSYSPDYYSLAVETTFGGESVKNVSRSITGQQHFAFRVALHGASKKCRCQNPAK